MKPIQQKYSDVISKLEIAFTDVMQEQRALQHFMTRLHWEKSKEGQKQVNYAKGTIKRENAYHDANPSDEYLDETKVLNALPGLMRDQRRLQAQFPDPALPGTNPWSWQINLGLMPRYHSDYNARINNSYAPERFKFRESCQMAAADHFEAEKLKQAVLGGNVDLVAKLWSKTGLDDGRDFNLYVDHLASGYRGRG